MRRCIACYKSFPQDELIRFTLQDGKIVRDDKFSADGRGYYLCNSKECFERAINKKIFNKLTKKNVIMEDNNVEKSWRIS